LLVAAGADAGRFWRFLAGKMTIETNLVPAGRRYRMRSAEDRVRAFQSAERHTRIVAILRRALPALAVLVLACYFISTRLSISVGDVTASISGIEVADGNLRMVNPKLKGADKKNGAYVIGADYADQDVKNPSIVKLHAIKAELSNPDGDWSRMEAVRGVFDSKAERLVMQEKITVATSSGVSGELKHASLDMKTQTLRSHQPVSFVLTNGNVKANAMTLESGKHTLTFRGKVLVHLIRPQDDDAKDPARTHKAVPQQSANPAPEATASTPGEDASPVQAAVPQ
jgi:lipopolysaccharide export system protein LptC